MTEDTNLQDAVFDVASSPNFVNDGICFVARTSGLARSTDGGTTWQDAYHNLEFDESLTTAAVALSPSFASDHSLFAGVSGGVLRSSDGGQNWHIASFPTPPPFVSTLVVSPDFERDGMVFAGTLEDGVFVSQDRGKTWAAWNFGLLDLNILALAISPDFANDETLFAGTESGIFGSTNGGRAWREVDFPMDYAPVLSLALSPVYSADGILFAGTEACGLFRSDDRGKNWSRIGEDSIAEEVRRIIVAPDFPTQPDLMVMLHETLLVSRDNGQTWANWQTGLDVGEGLAAIAAPQGIAPGSRLVIGLMGGGIQQI